jgi:uncharacterized protein YPO0396
MPRIKRGSTILETARLRLSALKTINPKPNFGPALDLEQYEQEIEGFSASLDEYNDTLSLLDRKQNDLRARETRLREKSHRMLAATKATYGPDSNEYENAGGTRVSEYKRNTKKRPDTT